MVDERQPYLEKDNALVMLMRYVDLTTEEEDSGPNLSSGTNSNEYIEAQGATFFMKDVLKANGAVRYCTMCTDRMCNN
jgi:hypothetical protein